MFIAFAVCFLGCRHGAACLSAAIHK
jgi:hypothetical protein